MIFPCCFVFTVWTGKCLSFMNWIHMSLEVTFLLCFVITLATRKCLFLCFIDFFSIFKIRKCWSFMNWFCMSLNKKFLFWFEFILERYAFMNWFYMFLKMIFPCSFVCTMGTWVCLAFMNWSNVSLKVTSLFCFVFTLVALKRLALMYCFHMFLKMIFPCCFVFTVSTWKYLRLMNGFYVSLKITFLFCFVCTVRARMQCVGIMMLLKMMMIFTAALSSFQLHWQLIVRERLEIVEEVEVTIVRRCRGRPAWCRCCMCCCRGPGAAGWPMQGHGGGHADTTAEYSTVLDLKYDDEVRTNIA